MLETVVKVKVKENEHEIKSNKVIDKVDCRYLDTKIYIEENQKEKT